jgi:cytochrome c-type biogenesis protein CcmE
MHGLHNSHEADADSDLVTDDFSWISIMTEKPPQDDMGRDGVVDDGYDDDLFSDDLDYGLPGDEKEGASWGIIIGVFVAMIAIAFVVFDGMQAETYFFDVHEAVERSAELTGETIRIRGDVQPGSFEGGEGQLESRFQVATEGQSMSIVYRRALPDTFEEDAEVVIQGRLEEGLVMYADEVLVKCPSRYEGAPPDHSGDGNYSDYDHAPEGNDPQASR